MLLIFSFLQLIDRSDFVGFITSLCVFYLYLNPSGQGISDHTKYLFNLLILSICFDIAWLVIHFTVS